MLPFWKSAGDRNGRKVSLRSLPQTSSQLCQSLSREPNELVAFCAPVATHENNIGIRRMEAVNFLF